MQTTPFLVLCERMGRKAKYKVHFQPNDQLIDRIKKLPKEQRIWNSYDFCWEITTKGLYEIIKIYKGSSKIHFEFDDKDGFVKQIKKIDADEKEKKRLLAELEESKKRWLKFKEELDEKYEDYKEVVHRELKDGVNLYPHQVTATMFLNAVRNGLLSHDMGTGKSLSSIAYCEMNGFEKVFVITPNSLKFNYYDEVEKFTNSKPHVVKWKHNQFSIEESKYIIVNYEYFNPSDKKTMDKKFASLGIDKIDCLVADESHRLKSSKSNTYKNFKRIFTKKIFRNEKVSKIFMTGTPTPNRSQELYTVLNQISPLDFPNKQFFYENYLGMQYDPAAFGGWVKIPSMEDLESLYHKIAPFTHRKKKSEVLQDLPDKVYQKIRLEMSNKDQRIYDDIEAGVANEFINEDINNPLTIMLRLRQYTASLKAHVVKEFIDEILEDGEKIVIMDYFKESLNYLKSVYKDKACIHTGDYSAEDRAMMVKEFQDPNSEVKVFLGSIQTCNYGLTLTAANNIFIVSLPFSVGEFDQAVDRCILKGELVLTKEGYTPIEKINVGDLVYTHKGNWKRVSQTSNKIERKKSFYDIKYKGFYKPLRCTEDHKIYVYDNENNDYLWVQAKDLNIFRHFMVMPQINLNEKTQEFFVKEHKTNSKSKKNINKNVFLNNTALLYAFGRYVGDGHVNNHQVSICGHIDEYSEVLFCIETIKSVFGLENHTEYYRDNKIEMYISSIELRNNFAEWFNCGAQNKSIPDFIFKLDGVLIKSFLNGYYSADGYRRKNTQQATTVSKYLTYQLVQLEGLLGNTPTLRYNEFARSWSFEYSINKKIKRNKLIINDDGNILYPLQEIRIYKPKRNDEKVYDLTVEDDNSFVVGLSTVHNCHRIGQKKMVHAFSFIFEDSIDEYVFKAIERKRREIAKVIDNEDYESDVTESVISEVMSKIKSKYGGNVVHN